MSEQAPQAPADESMRFMTTDGRVIEPVTFSNGQQHLYEVSEDGKKSPISHDVVLQLGAEPEDTTTMPEAIAKREARAEKKAAFKDAKETLEALVDAHEPTGSMESMTIASDAMIEEAKAEKAAAVAAEKAAEARAKSQNEAAKAKTAKEAQAKIDAGIAAVERRNSMGAENDDAQAYVWGTKGRGYTNPSNGGKFEDEGVLARIRKDRAFGTTEAEREGIARSYEEMVLQLVNDQGLELSDAVDLTDDWFDAVTEKIPDQTAAYMKAGLSAEAAEAKATDMYEHLQEVKLKKIREREAAADYWLEHQDELMKQANPELVDDVSLAHELAKHENGFRDQLKAREDEIAGVMTQRQRDSEDYADRMEQVRQELEDAREEADKAHAKVGEIRREAAKTELTRKQKARRWLAGTAIGAVLLGGAIVWGIDKAEDSRESNDYSSQIDGLNNQLDETKGDLTDTKQQLADTQDKLKKARDDKGGKHRGEHKPSSDNGEQTGGKHADHKLREGGTVWAVETRDLKEAGIPRTTDNLRKVTAFTLGEMGISWEQARHAAIGTKVPHHSPEELHKILDDDNEEK